MSQVFMGGGIGLGGNFLLPENFAGPYNLFNVRGEFPVKRASRLPVNSTSLLETLEPFRVDGNIFDHFHLNSQA